MTTKEKIAVMQAFEEGKVIEVCGVAPGQWAIATGPNWNWASYSYRIKPEPRMVPLEMSDIDLHRDLFRVIGRLPDEENGFRYYACQQMEFGWVETGKLRLGCNSDLIGNVPPTAARPGISARRRRNERHSH